MIVYRVGYIGHEVFFIYFYLKKLQIRSTETEACTDRLISTANELEKCTAGKLLSGINGPILFPGTVQNQPCCGFFHILNH